MLKKGDKVPNFSLKGIDANGHFRYIDLSDFEDKNIVLYFYPADGTQNCTIEACAFRDKLNTINRAVVIGISSDSVQSHALFREQYFLNFNLLSDEDHIVSDMFGAWDDEKG